MRLSNISRPMKRGEKRTVYGDDNTVFNGQKYERFPDFYSAIFTGNHGLATITRYTGTGSKNIAIPSEMKTIGGQFHPVGVIGKDAFIDNTEIEHIYLPRFVGKIEEGAFYNCTSLKTVMIPDLVVKLPKKCFAGCISLESVITETPIESVEEDTFKNCSNLRDINISPEVQCHKNSFDGCYNLPIKKLIELGDRGFMFDQRCFYSIILQAWNLLLNDAIDKDTLMFFMREMKDTAKPIKTK